MGQNSIAIGTNVISSEDNLVKLGNDNSNVKIDGNLFVKNVDIIEKLKFLENEINKLINTKYYYIIHNNLDLFLMDVPQKNKSKFLILFFI